MIKSVNLKLTKIKYSGDSIGDDIRVEIEAMGRIATIDKQIKVGATAEINREVGRFETDQKLFKTGVKITVVEKDLLFNDVGSAYEIINVDTVQTKPQEFVFKIQIRENRSSLLNKFWGKAVAVFEINLKAEALDVMQYVPDSDESKGWLNIRLESDKSFVSIPAYTKIKIEKADNKREYFVILEGAYRGKSASTKLRDDGSSQFISGVDHGQMARVQYSISQKTLFLNGKKYKTTDYREIPWQKGLYDIEIPDYPHSAGARYQKQAPRAKTWFRIGHGGARYLHTGGRSLGCLTVIEIARWKEIYGSLIKARKGDSVSVGVLEVVD
jgi:hypothetical protein